MGYLDNTSTTVDAILTKKGRELLARGGDEFKITKFALGDDEIDYGLFDVTHPNGTNSYGSAIENLPMLEAFPDENQIMRYKLVTLPKGTSKMPILELPIPSPKFQSKLTTLADELSVKNVTILHITFIVFNIQI